MTIGRGAVRHRAYSIRQRITRLEQWRKNQIAVTISGACIFFGYWLVMPFLPIFVRQLGVQSTAGVAFWSGVLLSSSPLASLNGLSLVGPGGLVPINVPTTTTTVASLRPHGGNVNYVQPIFSGFRARSSLSSDCCGASVSISSRPISSIPW